MIFILASVIIGFWLGSMSESELMFKDVDTKACESNGGIASLKLRVGLIKGYTCNDGASFKGKE